MNLERSDYMVELGQINRPSAEDFAGKRKLYCVANIFAIEDAPDDYKKLVDRYWDEVNQQLTKLETAGKIKKIFCEMISRNDGEALNIWSKVNERIPRLIREKQEEGAELIPIEDEDILGPYTDWGNCLRVIFSREVFKKVFEFFTEYSQKRFQHILNVIEENLSEAESGLLIMKDEDRTKIQFPKNIEVFLVTPPTYDDIMRWFRDKMGKKAEE
jgi:hypothetical protein